MTTSQSSLNITTDLMARWWFKEFWLELLGNDLQWNQTSSVSVLTGFLSVYVLTSANWDAVGHASVWNERSRAVTGQPGADSECVFYRQKDNPSVSNRPNAEGTPVQTFALRSVWLNPNVWTSLPSQIYRLCGCVWGKFADSQSSKAAVHSALKWTFHRPLLSLIQCRLHAALLK